MLKKEELTLNTTERKILFGIYEMLAKLLKQEGDTYQTLQEIKAMLVCPTREDTADLPSSEPAGGLVDTPTAYEASDYEGMSRKELIDLAREIPDKPTRWASMTHENLIRFLKEGI